MRRIALLMAMLAACCVPVCAQTANPVTNGGFEQLSPSGFPTDWEPVVGNPQNAVKEVDEARTGRQCLLLDRVVDDKEVGFNRAWKQDSGEQGKMLAEKQGALIFWYKVLAGTDAKFFFYAIPMSTAPLEKTGAARAFYEVPQSHIGDGKWHRAVVIYDYSHDDGVKWIHVSARIVGGTGKMLVDDVSYAEKVGPLLALTKFGTDVPRRPGEPLILRALIENIGDGPTGEVPVRLDLADGVKAQFVSGDTGRVPEVASDGTTLKVATLPAGGAQALRWELKGTVSAGARVGITAGEGVLETETSMTLQPDLNFIGLLAAPAVARVGDTVHYDFVVENRGNAVSPAVPLKWAASTSSLALHSPVSSVPPLNPGETRRIPVTATAKSPVDAGSITVDTGTEILRSVVAVRDYNPGLPAVPAFGARENAATVVLANAKIALIWPHTDRGFGLTIICRRNGQQLVPLGRTADLGQLALADEPVRHLFGHARVAHTASSATVTFDCPVPNGIVKCAFTLKRDSDHADFRSVFRLSAPCSVRSFTSPILFAGDGTYEENKTEAIFPGMEYLGPGEYSSSDLDIDAAHPDRIRYVPHPSKVTIPAMSVAAKDGCLALLWDPYQKWDGTHDRPNPIFASPDTFEGRQCHTMGLMVPTVPDWVDENERLARRPLALHAHDDLSLSGSIWTGPETEAVFGVMAWAQRFGLPKPMPMPHGDLPKEIAFSMKAYLDTLWVPEKKGWESYRGGPRLGYRVGVFAPDLFDLHIGSELAADAATRRACTALLREVQTDVEPDTSNDLGFLFSSDPTKQLSGAVESAANLLASRAGDGGYRFDANRRDQGVFKGRDYHELGRDDDKAVGLCARSTYSILEAARLLGANDVYKAALPALEYMQRFSIPRAAQVWEVPVHTPDILAASDAVDAYLDAYEFSGERRWLDDAVMWARRGLPFVYLWNTPEFPFLRYASIPVFGASWMKYSWFGRPVQWNGLRYAYTLTHLARYDSSFPWKQVAAGLTVSCMYQQAQSGKDLGLWPDNISAIDAKKSGWIFAPRNLLVCELALLGRDEEPQTARITTPDGEIAVSAVGKVRAHLDGDRLSADVTASYSSGTWILIAPLRAPKEVLLDGVKCKPGGDLKSGEMEYVAGQAALYVRIGQGSHKLVVQGAARADMTLLPQLATDIAFDFRGSAQGWIRSHDIGRFDALADGLHVTSTGGDPYMIRSLMKVPGDSVSTIVVRMKSSVSSYGQFYWTTDVAPQYAEERVVRFPVKASDDWVEYRIPVGADPGWRGHTITGIRLDPNNGTPGAEVVVAELRGVR